MKKLLALLVLLAAPAFAQINIGNGGAVNIGSGSGGGGRNLHDRHIEQSLYLDRIGSDCAESQIRTASDLVWLRRNTLHG